MSSFWLFLISGLLLGALYSSVALAVVLVYKSTQIPSLAHGQILAFGAVFFYILLSVGWPTFPSFLLALGLTGLLGFLVDRLVMRPLIGQPLFTMFLMTFAVFMFLDGFFNLYIQGRVFFIPPYLPKRILNLWGVTLGVDRISTFAMCLIPGLILIAFLRYSKLGLHMRASAENHLLAQSTGVRVKRIFTIIWIISSIIAAIGGIADTTLLSIRHPLPYVGLKGLIVAIVGGMESIKGAILGGLLVGVLETVAAGYLDTILGGAVNEVVGYFLLLIILIVKPYGLFGLSRIERI